MMSGNGVSSRSRARGGMKGRKLARIGFVRVRADDVRELVRRIARVDVCHADFDAGLTSHVAFTQTASIAIPRTHR